MTRQALPGWAVQRVASVLQADRVAGRRVPDPADLARRTGLSKSLARRCRAHLSASPHAATGPRVRDARGTPSRT